MTNYSKKRGYFSNPPKKSYVTIVSDKAMDVNRKYLIVMFQTMPLRWDLLTLKPGLTVDSITLKSKII